ncbi:MAG: hypothetical protein IJN39_03815 [Clostridia bacterium]|nr:hypothetical protein [Clostridia bacterium]
MVKRAFLRANIPFTVNTDIVFSPDFPDTVKEHGWAKCDISGDMLLKHINTSFNENAICFSKQLDNINFSIPCGEALSYDFSVTEIHVHCFETGVGIVSLHIPYDSDVDDSVIVNTCSILRCSAKHEEAYKGRSILRNGKETYLSCLAEEELSTLFGNSFVLFEHLNENSMRRIDMFSAALCDNECLSSDSKCCDKLCYRLANTYDDRDKDITLNESDFYRQQEYTRWSFSKRGCAVVANLTGLDITDNFLKDRWFFSVQSNYIYLYLMVLHQKYAIYSYLNTVAADSERKFVKANQESLIEFNSKYIFSIVSDEHFLQKVYLRMKNVNNVDEVYSDLLDELKRLFEYSQLKSDENNETRNTRLNILSVIISVLCSCSVIFDTLSIFSENGYHLGFDTHKNLICTGFFALELVFFFVCFIFVFIINKKKK